MDYVNPLKKNQTARVLERFFYAATGKDYISMIPDKDENYGNLPTINEVTESINKAINFAKVIILNTDKVTEINDDVFNKYVCDLNPLVDKIIAANIADLLNRQSKFEKEEQLTSIWIPALEELRAEFKKVFALEKSSNGEVDTTNLEIGMVVKGYKELCELLHERQLKSGSNPYKAQLKRWARYFKMEKGNGRKIVILDIYDEPFPIEDARKAGNRNIYLKYIETILLKYIHFRKGNECYATRNQLWNILGMINCNYKKIPISILQADVNYNDVTKWELDNFYMRCNSKLNTVLFSALNNLCNRSLISYQIQTMIVVPNTDKKDTPCKHYLADDDEIRRILAVERSTLNKMGLESKNHAACTMRLNEFYNKVNKRLNELYGWERKYERIKIIFNEKDIQEAITKNEYELQKLYLNELVVDAINKNAQTVSDNRMKKALLEYAEYLKEWEVIGWGEPYKLEEIDDIFTYPTYYVDIQKKLSEKFLSIKPKEAENKTIQYDKELDELFDNLGVD